MSDDNDFGGLEDRPKSRDGLAFCRAFQKLSPVGGPSCGDRRVIPAAPPLHHRVCRRSQAGRHLTLPPGTAFAIPGHRGQNQRAMTSHEVQAFRPSPVYAGSPSSQRVH